MSYTHDIDLTLHLIDPECGYYRFRQGEHMVEIFKLRNRDAWNASLFDATGQDMRAVITYPSLLEAARQSSTWLCNARSEQAKVKTLTQILTYINSGATVSRKVIA